MSTNYKELWDISEGVNCALADIDEAMATLDVLYDRLEFEGYQHREDFDQAQAIIFGKRFPQYLAMLNIIRRELERNIKDIRSISDSVYEAYVAQRAEEKEVEA